MGTLRGHVATAWLILSSQLVGVFWDSPSKKSVPQPHVWDLLIVLTQPESERLHSGRTCLQTSDIASPGENDETQGYFRLGTCFIC